MIMSIFKKNSLKKGITYVTTVTTILWSMGGALLVPLQVQAAVTQATAPVTGHTVGQEPVAAQNASVAVATFALTTDGADTFTNIKFTINDVSSSGTAASDFSAFSLFRDAGEPSLDELVENQAAANKDTVMGGIGGAFGGSIAIGSQLTGNLALHTGIPTSMSTPVDRGTYEYVLAATLSGTAVTGHKFTVTLAANDAFIINSPGAPATVTSSALTTGTFTIDNTAAPVSMVAGADTDTTGPGIDGRDFRVSWTPAAQQPAGFTGTKLYILPVANLAVSSTVQTTGCAGNACQDRGFFGQFQQNQFVVPQNMATDSAGAIWSGATYKACLLVMATINRYVCSTGFSVTSDTVTDINPPFIDHTQVSAAQASADAIVHAVVQDDQTLANEFGTAPAYIKLFYGANLLSAESSVDAVNVTGNLFKFTIPAASVPAAGGSLQYYLTARDKTAGSPGNVKFSCATPGPTSAAACKSTPFTMKTAAAGLRTVIGTIKANESGGLANLGSAKVYVEGFATAAVNTAGDGTYTVSGLPNSNSFNFAAYKSTYCKNKRQATILSSNLTGIDITLNPGECSFGGGGGGGGMPTILFSGPPPNSMSVAINEKIRIGINMAMNAGTINDTDASNAGSNVYLYKTADAGATKVAGQALYCANQAAAGCSTIPPQDTNVILFSPTAALDANTNYTLVITEAITSGTGASLQGSRPGGGHMLSFTTQGAMFSAGTATTNFGQGGQYLPPFVKSMNPSSGNSVTPNIKITVEFNEGMDTTSISTSSIKLVKRESTGTFTDKTISVTIDNNEYRFVTVTPSAQLAAGDYEVRVLGSVKNTQGMTMRSPDQAAQIAFSNTFSVSGSADSTAPTIYPSLSDGSTGVAVNVGSFEFGFNEPMDFSTMSSTNITLQSGATAVNISAKYDPGNNSASIIPDTVLIPNTTYTVTFGTGVKDAPGNALAAARTYTYTTGDADSAQPKLKEARCDDFKCYISFTEPMNHDTAADSNFAASVLKNANWTLERITPSTSTISITTLPINYDSKGSSISFEGYTGLAAGDEFRITASSLIADLSGNPVVTAGSANVLKGRVENSKNTFGSFGDQGMFGPPVAGVGTSAGGAGGGAGATIGGQFKPQGFGTFSAEQAAMGQADRAWPFNSMASQDSNVFQVNFNANNSLQNGDLVVLTFPSGTTITNAAPDTKSPSKDDFNMGGNGTVTFDNTYDTDGVAVDTAARTVTVKLAITGGTPGAGDYYTIDLKKIVNPSIPKGPETGGYTLGINITRSGSVLANKTSMPYYIMAGGSNTITLKVYAGTAVTGTAGATGTVNIFGGGPGGPMGKTLTLTNGITTAADGTAIAGDAGVVYSSLPDGCYGLGTEPSVTLGSVDYFGQMSPEPICVNSSAPTATKNIVLTAATAGSTVALTVKLSPANFNFAGNDLDIFAGGPGPFVVKTLTGVNTPDPAGYTLRLNANGNWFIGVGPARPKGTSSGREKALPGVPPPPVNINVRGVGGTPTISSGFMTPPGVTIDAATKTITFTFAAADKAVTGTVTDGTSGLGNIDVFMHAQVFGSSARTTTDDNTATKGAFTLNVSEYGTYELGVFKDGLPPVFGSIDVRSDGNFYKGKKIDGSNPLVIKVKKGAYTISGKVLDSSGNGIKYAPIFATDANGTMANGGTSGDGSYSIFVDAGTWTVKSELPPDKTDMCGTFSKTVVVSTESMANQNISPSTGTCYTLTGTVTVGGTAQATIQVNVVEWDSTNNRPVSGGISRPLSTNSSGVYSAKVKGNATYRVSTWSNGSELSTTKTITTDATNTANVDSGTTGTITFAFTGGTSTMQGFVEVKKSDDQFTRISKSMKDLSTNITMTAKQGTYNYFVDVFGGGKFSGTVATGSTATVNLSAVNLVTLSGNVKDTSSANVSGALITAKDSAGFVQTTTTDSSGNYSLATKAGTYTVSTSKAQYVAQESGKSVAVSANTANYDFGGTSPDQLAIKKAPYIISGTIFKSDGTTKATEGSVSGVNADGTTVTSTIDAQSGSYTLSVDAGSWTVKAAAPLHAKTTGATVTVTTADQTGKNITLTADNTKTSTSASTSLDAATGGTVDDRDNTGIKVVAPPGVLASADTVKVDVGKSFTAPDTDTLKPLGDASFEVSASKTTSSGTSTVKDLTGTADLEFDYTALVSQMPSGVSESDLKLVYYSPEKAAYVPVEGGFTVDPDNNKISGKTSHFTSFAIVYAPVTSSSGGARDTNPPGNVTGVAGTSANGKITVTWTDPTDADLANILVYRNYKPLASLISGDTAHGTVGKGAKTFVDNGPFPAAGGTYKYQLIAQDTAGNTSVGTSPLSVVLVATVATGGGGSSGSSGSSGSTGGTTTGSTTPAATTPAATTPAATTPVVQKPAETKAAEPTTAQKRAAQLELIVAESGVIFLGDAESVASLTNKGVSESALTNADTLVSKIGKGLDLSNSQETRMQLFIGLGTSTTLKLGEGERAGVLGSYAAAYGQMPETAEDWADVLKIANGRFPSETNADAEAKAKVKFKKVYKRDAVVANANDSAAINIMAYGLRNEVRNTGSEKAAIVSFKSIFKKNPSLSAEWDVMRAISYSGAKR